MGRGVGGGWVRISEGGQLEMLYSYDGVLAGDAEHLQRCDYLKERHFLQLALNIELKI